MFAVEESVERSRVGKSRAGGKELRLSFQQGQSSEGLQGNTISSFTPHPLKKNNTLSK